MSGSGSNTQPPAGKPGLGARLGFALGRAVGTTVRSLAKSTTRPEAPTPPAQVREVGRSTQTAETCDDAGRKVVLRRTTIDEVEIQP